MKNNEFDPEIVVKRVRYLLSVWRRQIDELKPKVEALEKYNEDPQNQHAWDEWLRTEEHLDTLTKAYRALRAALGS